MLDENDSKIIVEQLEEKLKTLHKCETMYTRQMAMSGSKLNECYIEIDRIESVLEKLVNEENDDE